MQVVLELGEELDLKEREEEDWVRGKQIKRSATHTPTEQLDLREREEGWVRGEGERGGLS